MPVNVGCVDKLLKVVIKGHILRLDQLLISLQFEVFIMHIAGTRRIDLGYSNAAMC